MKTGENIRIRSPSGTWRPAECFREVAPRLYKVLVDGGVRHRSKKDIWRTVELQNLQTLLRKLNPLPKFKGLLLRRKDIWQTVEPQNTQTSKEIEPFAEVQRAPFASPGPASTPIEAACVGDCVTISCDVTTFCT